MRLAHARKHIASILRLSVAPSESEIEVVSDIITKTAAGLQMDSDAPPNIPSTSDVALEGVDDTWSKYRRVTELDGELAPIMITSWRPGSESKRCYSTLNFVVVAIQINPQEECWLICACSV